MNPNQPVIDIELLYLDLDTCDRCRQTDSNLDAAIDQVGKDLAAQGFTVRLQRRHVTTEAEAAALGFEISPTIRVNGRDIQLDWRASGCGSCTELAGGREAVDCRVWHWQGEEHHAAPVAMVAEAIRKAAIEGPAPAEPAKPGRASEPMRRFFARAKQSSCCS